MRTCALRFYFVPWQPTDVSLWDRVACSDQDGWCHRCGRLEPIERIPPAEAIADEARARWRRDRRPPPRCLCCGSTRVEPLDDSFRHPHCGGRLEVAGDPWHNHDAICPIVPAEGPPERHRVAVWWSHLLGRW